MDMLSTSLVWQIVSHLSVGAFCCLVGVIIGAAFMRSNDHTCGCGQSHCDDEQDEWR